MLKIPITESETNEDSVVFIKKRNTVKKNGLIYGFMIFLSTSIDVSFLNNQYYYGKAGVLGGFIVIGTIISFTCFISVKILKIADYLERKHPIVKVQTLSDLASRVIDRRIGIPIKINVFLYNWAAIVINGFVVSRYIQRNLNALTDNGFLSSDNFSTFLFMLICVFSIVLIAKPKKLGTPALIAVIFLILSVIIVLIVNVEKLAKDGFAPYILLFNKDYFSSLVGNTSYAISYMGTTFGVRTTLKKRTDLNKIVIYQSFVMAFLFNAMGFVFLSVS